jgi:hypothetical protein
MPALASAVADPESQARATGLRSIEFGSLSPIQAIAGLTIPA